MARAQEKREESDDRRLHRPKSHKPNSMRLTDQHAVFSYTLERYMSMNGHAATIRRLKRIEGQVRGIARMLEQERYLVDTLHQMQAIKSALARAESEILKVHATNSVDAAMTSRSAKAQKETISDLIDLFDKLKR